MGEWWDERVTQEREEDSWLDWGESWEDTSQVGGASAPSQEATTYAETVQPQEPPPPQSLEEVSDFVTLIQLLKEPFDYLSPYMGGSLFFNLMKLNFELITDRIARAYLMERQQRGNQELPPEMERGFVELLIRELKSAENRIWDYILWLREVVEAKKREEEEPPPPDWLWSF